MVNLSSKRNNQSLLYLIKSCENLNLTEEESIQAIRESTGKEISRRTYYNYKRKLFDKEIFKTLKNSIYDSKGMRCLLLELEETDRLESKKADELISEQFPDRKSVFEYTDNQVEGMKHIFENIESRQDKLENRIDAPLQKYESTPENSNIREEHIRCGKENCEECPHGPYYYTYWKDKETGKLKKNTLVDLIPLNNFSMTFSV